MQLIEVGRAGLCISHVTNTCHKQYTIHMLPWESWGKTPNVYTVKLPNNGTPRSDQTLYNGHTEWNGMLFLYLEEGPTSLQRRSKLGLCWEVSL